MISTWYLQSRIDISWFFGNDFLIKNLAFFYRQVVFKIESLANEINDRNLKVKDYFKSGKFPAFYTIFLMFFILSVPHTAFSRDLNTLDLLGGLISSHEDRETSYTWQISYMEDIDDHFGWSFSWLNEGHMPNHHRDGPTLQLWAKCGRCRALSCFWHTERTWW